MTTRYASITKESELIKYYIKVKKKMRSAKDYIWDSEAHHPCQILPTGHH